MNQKQSHYHPFNLNWKDHMKEMRRGNLPIAIPILGDLPDYQALLEFVGKEFKISNIADIPAPGWEARLL